MAYEQTIDVTIAKDRRLNPSTIDAGVAGENAVVALRFIPPTTINSKSISAWTASVQVSGPNGMLFGEELTLSTATIGGVSTQLYVWEIDTSVTIAGRYSIALEFVDYSDQDDPPVWATLDGSFTISARTDAEGTLPPDPPLNRIQSHNADPDAHPTLGAGVVEEHNADPDAHELATGTRDIIVRTAATANKTVANTTLDFTDATTIVREVTGSQLVAFLAPTIADGQRVDLIVKVLENATTDITFTGISWVGSVPVFTQDKDTWVTFKRVGPTVYGFPGTVVN